MPQDLSSAARHACSVIPQGLRVSLALQGALAVASVILLTGCQPPPPPPKPQPVLYSGPLLTTPQIVQGLQARYAPLRTIWSRHDFAVSVLDNRGRVRTLDGEGVLLLRKRNPGTEGPTDLRLTGTKDIAGTVFDLGANRERAWLTLHGDIDTLYWLPQGAEPVDPRAVPIRPDLVAEVLGVSDWVTDLSRYPTPVVTYQSDSDTYRITLVEPAPPVQGGGIYLKSAREVWVDRSTLMIKRIVFYASDARPAVEANLGNWVALRGTAGAFVPTDISLSFPLSKATMRFTLRDPVASRNNLPSDISFRFPAKLPVSKEVRLDQP